MVYYPPFVIRLKKNSPQALMTTANRASGLRGERLAMDATSIAPYSHTRWTFKLANRARLPLPRIDQIDSGRRKVCCVARSQGSLPGLNDRGDHSIRSTHRGS